jgi:bacteriorhodopsin
MKQTQKFLLYGLAALLALVVVARMMTSAPASTEDANTEVLVSQLIENDPLIAPLRPR